MKRFILGIWLGFIVSCSGNDNSELPACTATITWSMPVEQDLTELSKFTIYMSSQPNVEGQFRELEIDITDVFLITWEARNISSGTHYFYMAAIDKVNNISAYSNILSKTC